MEPEINNEAQSGQTDPKVGETTTTPEATTSTQAVSSEEITRLKEENAKAKGYMVALTQQLSQLMNERNREPEIPQEERVGAIKKLLEDDPETALDAHFRERIAPIIQQNRQTLSAINRDRFVEKVDKDTWKKWGPKVEEFMAPLNEETKSMPGAWEKALNFVLAENIEDVIAERMRAAAQKTQQQSMLEGSSNGAAASRVERSMSPIEKQIAAEFGMTDDEWKKFGSANYQPTEE